jgi:hypothetical protein
MTIVLLSEKKKTIINKVFNSGYIYSTSMYKNGKVVSVETISGMGVVGDKEE